MELKYIYRGRPPKIERSNVENVFATKLYDLVQVRNNWSPNEGLMKEIDGIYEKTLYLKKGEYAYKFIVDGQWLSDDNADNYDYVIRAAEIFHSHKGFNLGYSRITISTAGMLPQIKRFINEKQRYKLAISLNAVSNKVRNSIMPINKKWNIQDIIQAGKEYSNQKKCTVMFEYVLLKGINDYEEDAINLSHLLSGIECKINLIPYNETDGKYQRPGEKTITRFSEILHKNRNLYRVLVRWSKGQDIDAGCGQLAGQNL